MKKVCENKQKARIKRATGQGWQTSRSSVQNLYIIIGIVGNNNSRKCWHISLLSPQTLTEILLSSFGHWLQQHVFHTFLPYVRYAVLRAQLTADALLHCQGCSSQLASMPDFADLLTSCSENSTYWKESCAEYDVANHQGKEIGFLQKKVVSVLQLLHRKTEHVVHPQGP